MKASIRAGMYCLALITASVASGSPAAETADAPVVSPGARSALPPVAGAKAVLNTTMRHREWIRVPISKSTSVLAWVMYPDRSDRAPLVVLSGESLAPTDWTRAVSDQLAAEGYLVVVPDVLTEVDARGDRRPAGTGVATDVDEIARRVDAVQATALRLPAASGVTAYVDLDPTRGRIAARASGTRTEFSLSAAAWPDMVSYLNERTVNRPVFVPNEHAGHMAMLQAAQAAGRGPAPAGPLVHKDPRLPATYFTAKSTLLNSKLKTEWIDIPVDGSAVKLHTLVIHPQGTAKTGVVLVMQHGSGMDDWQRALAHQVAEDGFIAVLPDLWSGTGPNGGGWDASEFGDDAMRAAAGKITPDEGMRRYKAARDYALKLPRANGKIASIGFCMGGENSFRFAGEVPELNGAVIYYGGPPDESIMRQIKAPVLGFYGENDARVTSTVEPTKGAMARLGKQYESHV